MIIIAHGLWATAIYKPKKETNWKKAVFWAMFPDIFLGLFLIPYLGFFRQPIPTDFDNAVWWFYHTYGLSHSLIVASIAIIGSSVILKEFPWEMLAWPLLHVLPDIPGHTHFRTPFLYPISDFSITGLFSWHEPLYRFISHLLPLLIILFPYLRRKIIIVRAQSS